MILKESRMTTKIFADTSVMVPVIKGKNHKDSELNLERIDILNQTEFEMLTGHPGAIQQLVEYVNPQLHHPKAI